MRLSFLFLIILTLLSSCLRSELKTEVECLECIEEEPQQGAMIIYFTRDIAQRSPQILLLGGYWEERNIIDTILTDTVPAYRDFLYYQVNLEHYYTVAAIYIRDNDTIYAVDGSYVGKEHYYNADCDLFCWRIIGNNFNIKLKNYGK